MKIRTDFVTNSSSSSYILAINFTADNGSEVSTQIAVSSESCFSEDGELTGDCIELVPVTHGGKIIFGGNDMSSAKSIIELNNMLFSAASIENWRGMETEDCCDGIFVIAGKLKYFEDKEELVDLIEDEGGEVTDSVSEETTAVICNKAGALNSKTNKAQKLGVPVLTEKEFLKRYLPNEYEDYVLVSEDGDFGELSKSVAEACPKTIAKFSAECEKNGITTENLTQIVIENQVFGSGDSARWIPIDENKSLMKYINKYRNTSAEDEKESILRELVEFFKSEPTLVVKDNTYNLPETMKCAWSGTEVGLVKECKSLLEGNAGSYYMGTPTQQYTIDFKNKVIKEKYFMKF